MQVESLKETNRIELTRWQHEDLILYSSKRVCCDQGKRVHCVCRVSVTCPVHGSICIGTHD
jgi:hypothetical protein